MASKASMTANTRAAMGISSPANPYGYPRPSQRSWWYRTRSRMVSSSTAELEQAGVPETGWSLTISNSSGVRRAGFCRISAGVSSLPRSCRAAPCVFRRMSASSSPTTSPIARA
ncbi:MAG: hypothetical protein R3B49_09825 [Phycisphaerales bacterium]